MENGTMRMAIIVIAAVFITCILVCMPFIMLRFHVATRDFAILAAIKRLRGLNFEVEVVLRVDGTMFSETTQYNPEFVVHTEQQVALFRSNGDLTQIHNHVDDIPPSLQDLLYAAEADFAQIIVVTPHWVYYVSRPTTGWKKETELLAALEKYFQLFETQRVGDPEFVMMAPDGSVIKSENYEVTSTDEALAAVCRDLQYALTKVEQ